MLLAIVIAGAFLFSACHRDQTGKSNTQGLEEPERASAKMEAGPTIEDFFAPNTVQNIHLTVDQADLDKMHAALPERIYVPGTFRWNQIEQFNVGIRYKGNSSSHPDAPFKRSFLIKFGEYSKGQKFLGLRNVALDNGIQFGGLFSEILILEILKDLDIPASRANYARLFLNDDFMGIYVNVERIDESGDPSFYAKAFEPKTHEKSADHRALAEWIDEINDTPDENLIQALEEHFQLDHFLSMTAVFLLSGAFDQYTGWNPHNYYLYQEPASNKWSYIPWDLDVGFVEVAFGHIRVLEDWNAAYPYPVAPRPLLKRICDNPTLLERYRQIADKILEQYFRPERLHARIDSLYALIQQDLEIDPFPPGRITVPTERAHADVVTGIKEFIAKRYAKARDELDHPQTTPPLQPEALRAQQRASQRPPEQGPAPAPGPASDQDPSDLRVEEVTNASVTIRWTRNAEDPAAHIIQRITGTEPRAFQNYRPVMGPVGETFEDTEIQPGETYSYRVYAVFPKPDGTILGTGPSNSVTITIPGTDGP
jgi:hypothetical protein